MKMTSSPHLLASGHYSLFANNSESSRTPSFKLESYDASPILKMEDIYPNNPYLTAAINGPSHTKITDHRPVPDTWTNVIDMIASETMLIEIARLANSLLLRAEADAVPHHHYPSTGFNNLAASTSDVRFTLPYNHRIGTTTTITTITTKSRSVPVSAPARKNRRTKSKHTFRPTRLLTTRQRNKLAHLHFFIKTFHCPSAAVRAPGDSRPLIKFYSKRVLNPKRPHFFRRRFLAGPPEKAKVGDNRVFYVRDFLSSDE